MRQIPSVSQSKCHIIKCITGANGERFPEFGGIANAYCNGLFFAFFECKKRHIAKDTIQKILNGTAPFPRQMLQYYDSDHGADDILQGVTRLVDACMCMRRLHTIQDDVHEQLLTCQGLDGSAIACTEKYYCGKILVDSRSLHT